MENQRCTTHFRTNEMHAYNTHTHRGGERERGAIEETRTLNNSLVLIPDINFWLIFIGVIDHTTGHKHVSKPVSCSNYIVLFHHSKKKSIKDNKKINDQSSLSNTFIVPIFHSFIPIKCYIPYNFNPLHHKNHFYHGVPSFVLSTRTILSTVDNVGSQEYTKSIYSWKIY